MNVGAVKGSAYAQGPGQQNPQLKAIDTQIGQLKKSIQELKANEKMDAKTKQKKIKKYEEQIAQLQAQKAQIQADAQKTRAEKATANQSGQEKPDEGKDGQETQISQKTQSGLIQRDSALGLRKQLGPIRADIESQIFAAENSSYLEPADPEDAAELRGKLNDMDSAVSGRVQDAFKTIKSEQNEDVKYVGKTNSASGAESANPADGGNAAADKDKSVKRGKGTGRMETGQFMNEEV